MNNLELVEKWLIYTENSVRIKTEWVSGESRKRWLDCSGIRSIACKSIFPIVSQKIVYEHYRQSIEQIENRIKQLDQEIARLLPNWSLHNLVNQRQALKDVAHTSTISVVKYVFRNLYLYLCQRCM